ncbi:uncharacterized protein K489DRAFT_361229 [Dissoconium aciculare CBS 342.82]|uniref:MOSC domain-containing protein n=1 Tax=Dissoconium aciculare CBS 342.82 TaxID=1314786 RepID=A0A6J3LZQ5_9PEZI|nr:uncharacterized protein K489DRAFT_361229 [Dissoconium aciculare CBS 342.82]KAF1820739.1 hypothetical protein K489DRAFT_361229 [Dissoconium aciculare CBS 342.82]
MQISRLLTYPIKSLRAVELESSELTQLGFPYDRRFMLLEVTKDTDDGKVKYENIHIAIYYKAALFRQRLSLPGPDPIAEPGEITVSFHPPDDDGDGHTPREIVVPLTPGNTADLEVIEVVMHQSATRAYLMGQKYTDFFSACFGMPVVLAYLGEHQRPVRMSHDVRDPTTSGPWQEQEKNSWLGSLSSMTASASSYILGGGAKSEPRITFADCAPYLVASERSLEDLHRRLPEGELMDITKFRPNIVVSGADEPWEEDFWTELTVAGTTRIACVQNCGRCLSINVDYATGAGGVSAAGKMLKLMQKDRRVDPGMKYSPIFGRYAFIGSEAQGHSIRVGDVVKVSKRTEQRTVFGMSSPWPERDITIVNLVDALTFEVRRLGRPLHSLISTFVPCTGFG